MKELEALVRISRHYGSDKDYTVAGGGNTSYKNKDYIWIKASGEALAEITPDGFARLYREKVKIIGSKTYSNDPETRESEVKADLMAASVSPESGVRPSVETSFHELIEYTYVVHTHPTMVNALMCSANSAAETKRLFGEIVLYLPYAPGYLLFKSLMNALEEYRQLHRTDPKLIFLENHGIFVSADSPDEIMELYAGVISKLKNEIRPKFEFEDLGIGKAVTAALPGIRMKLSGKDKPVVLSIRHHTLHRQFYLSEASFKKISNPFIPDMIVYCGSSYLYLEKTVSWEELLEELSGKLVLFEKEHGYLPKILVMKNGGVIAAGANAAEAENAQDMYEDLLKVSYCSEVFGGPRPMSKQEIRFIDNWEVENFRRKSAAGENVKSPVDQKIIIVTGAAQGFGAGIAESLVKEGANVVISDINEAKGKETSERVRQHCKKNRVIFIGTDVGNKDSVELLLEQTVQAFGGLDVLISNAGILHAGGIDEMDPSVFDKMTTINYNAWFYCVRAASIVMKTQSAIRSDHMMDLIQVNSKSGLEGSNRNFAYSGAKFGGIGLTQSFALELAPFGIKVNAVCPGNFFEGPLWSDPVNGLFIQYLKSGKVPGAKSVEDVRKYYEGKVPLGRGCRVEDIMKAIFYIIVQRYETGQAIPVTGGQVMLH